MKTFLILCVTIVVCAHANVLDIPDSEPQNTWIKRIQRDLKFEKHIGFGKGFGSWGNNDGGFGNVPNFLNNGFGGLWGQGSDQTVPESSAAIAQNGDQPTPDSSNTNAKDSEDSNTAADDKTNTKKKVWSFNKSFGKKGGFSFNFGSKPEPAETQ